MSLTALLLVCVGCTIAAEELCPGSPGTDEVSMVARHVSKVADQQKQARLPQRSRFGRQAPSPGTLPDASLSSEDYYKKLRSLILESCGQACELVAKSGKGKFFDVIEKKNQCSSLFSASMAHLDAFSNVWPPPQSIPEPMRADFFMEPQVRNMTVQEWYLTDKAVELPEAYAKSWTEKELSAQIERYDQGNFGVPLAYGASPAEKLAELIKRHKADLEKKHCAVLGSVSPWVEALLLRGGVGKVTTIEYSNIHPGLPQITAMHPSDWAGWYNVSQGSGFFDCVFSFSSLEHAGLGRYGDVMNPWGDLIAMGKLSCSTKEGGLLFIGLPTKDTDSIAWNAHRYYGPVRWAQMLANTEQLELENADAGPLAGTHSIVVARKL